MAHEAFFGDHSAHILSVLRRKIRLLCSRIRRLIRKRPRLKIVIRRLRRFGSKVRSGESLGAKNSSNNGQFSFSFPERPIRIATFNVAMFTLAPAVPSCSESSVFDQEEEEEDFFVFGNNRQKPGGLNSQLRSILKQSPLHSPVNSRPARSNLKVSINLPENEISIANSKLLGFIQENDAKSSPFMITNSTNSRSKVPVRSPICFPYSLGLGNSRSNQEENLKSGKSILEVLREVNADILALQDVKAEEEKGMRPLSDLASALGMHYVFAESWAPEYGNAILSRWPIKQWRVQKIADDDDFRNVLKATIDVPWAGELSFNCTQLDHLDEFWRMKQIRAIVQSYDPPHILAGGLNSLDESDYSTSRWMDIVKYYEDMGKPTPKVEVTKFLKGKDYIDAKNSAGDCEPVVIIAKGQNVQGTCKYGTRVDYMWASPEAPYKFVPNSYSVISSKGTSDHHIVKVDVVKASCKARKDPLRQQQKARQKALKVRYPCRSVWQVKA
ncbi:hypothetical protein BT93_L5853 [Corymbia citriodora subsp. variegata]|uniref:Endonuclease/exonuclease/phosphatase domain-containing protein n=1 Tax=Corymbia citriodora subsp. variegata TaxID=360336 RepID=A0A8T0CR28_CORYI|nr:hypothetical protein BT93_L5853 [Corymbia citriodora subsp. variegata]